MARIDELLAQGGGPSNKVGVFESMLAGIGSGLIQIPKGLFSLGATLLDLGVNSGKAAEVEQWFDDLTTWDEKAEATAAGKITELLVNIGVPGGYGFKLGSQLAKQSMLAAKGGKYLNLSNKSLQKGVKQAAELNAKGKTRQFITGAIAGGVAEGVFVGDVEKIGSFGDLIGGPTKITRGDGEDAVRDLLNRVKFGTEGALFTGVIGGVGSTIKKLASRNKKLDIANSKWDAFLDKFAGKLRARSDWTPEGFDIVRTSKGARGADTAYARNASRELDTIIDSAFPPLRTILNKQTAKDRDIILKELNEVLLSGEPKLVDEIIDGKKTGKMIVEWGSMDAGKIKTIANKFADLDVDPDSMGELWGVFMRIRDRWGKLFTELGGTLDPNDVKEFRNVFGDKFKSYLGATYDIMQNQSILPWLRYKPTRESIEEVKNIFKKTYAEVHPGQVLDDLEAEQHVISIIESTKLPKGFRMDVPSDPYFNIPKFFAGKTVLRETGKGTARGGRRSARLDPNLSDIVKEYKFPGLKKPTEVRGAFERLLGKQHNPMQTILGATAKLSLLAQRNIFYRNIWSKNDELLDKALKEIEATGKTNIEPIFVKGRENADKFFGNRTNYRRIDVIDESQKGRVGMNSGASNPFTREADVYAKKGVAEALERQGFSDLKPTLMGSEMLGQLYSGLILYPKATSQIAKTILSPVTHMRNFFSAGAFAAANGIFPASFAKVPVTIAGKETLENPMKLAYQALQTGLKGTRMQNELYDKLLKLGVVNTNVRIGDLSRLLKDVNFGETLTYQKGFRGLLKQLSKIKEPDILQKRALEIVTYISETVKIPKEVFGITGSILIDIHNTKFSDVDLTVMGGKNGFKLKKALPDLFLEKDGPMNYVSENVLKKLFSDRVKEHPLSLDEVKSLNSRQWNYGTFKGTIFSLHTVRSISEITNNYGDHFFHSLGIVKGEAIITDTSESLFNPHIYKIEKFKNSKECISKDIKEVVSYSGIYGGKFEINDEVALHGKLEIVENKTTGTLFHRIIIGSPEAGGHDYMKPI